jgi:hypothetical protein
MRPVFVTASVSAADVKKEEGGRSENAYAVMLD